MMADPFEVILYNMRRTAQDGPDSIDFATIRDQYGIDPLSDEFNDCRMS